MMMMFAVTHQQQQALALVALVAMVVVFVPPTASSFSMPLGTTKRCVKQQQQQQHKLGIHHSRNRQLQGHSLLVCYGTRIDDSCTNHNDQTSHQQPVCRLSSDTTVEQPPLPRVMDRRNWFHESFCRSCSVLPILVAGSSSVSIPTEKASATTFVSSTIPYDAMSKPSFPTVTTAVTTTSAISSSSKLDDLPPEAQRSYLQYRFQLQTAADYYIFELQDLLMDVNRWGEIGELFTGSTPTRIERDFINLFRIIGLSMPPDESDLIRTAQYNFERATTVLSKATAGIRRDLPIDVDPKLMPLAIQGWDDGRIALNEVFTVLNTVTGLNELRLIPQSGPNQYNEYGRSAKRYVELKKKLRLCQNRGGPTLSQAWGTLMVSGYLQDSCGIPDLESYFYQT